MKESPDFLAEQEKKAKQGAAKAAADKTPLMEVLRGAPGLLALAVGANVLGIAGFYFTNTFMLAYTTQYVGLSRAVILDSLLLVSIMQFFITRCRPILPARSATAASC